MLNSEKLINELGKLGYPEGFSQVIAENLRTDKAIDRMVGYLRSARPGSAEEIVDEMLAIIDDRDRWIKKKIAENSNSKITELYNSPLSDEEEEEDEEKEGEEEEEEDDEEEEEEDEDD